MKVYNNVHSDNEPQLIQITSAAVFIASNIHPYEEIIDEHISSGYEYNLTQYDKDEYLLFLAQQNNELKDELQATKILLGVE